MKEQQFLNQYRRNNIQALADYSNKIEKTLGSGG